MDKVRILGRMYRVKKCHLDWKDGWSLLGDINYQKHTIRINVDNCKEQCQEALLHEVLHAVSMLTGSNLSERQVLAMSNGLYSVLKDNKKLLGE
jgi:hypothetical protein